MQEKMTIEIIKRTNINGKVVNVGDKCDASFLAPQDLRTLLNCGCARIVEDFATVETADATPKMRTADNAPKTAKRKGR